MWLAVSLVLLVLVILATMRAYATSPEAQDLTYQVVKAAIKSTKPWYTPSPHQLVLIGSNRVMVCNRVEPKRIKYKLYVTINKGTVTVSNFCRHGEMEVSTSLSHLDGIEKLGVIINEVITKHLAEGCSVYEPNFDF